MQSTHDSIVARVHAQLQARLALVRFLSTRTEKSIQAVLSDAAKDTTFIAAGAFRVLCAMFPDDVRSHPSLFQQTADAKCGAEAESTNVEVLDVLLEHKAFSSVLAFIANNETIKARKYIIAFVLALRKNDTEAITALLDAFPSCDCAHKCLFGCEYDRKRFSTKNLMRQHVILALEQGRLHEDTTRTCTAHSAFRNWFSNLEIYTALLERGNQHDGFFKLYAAFGPSRPVLHESLFWRIHVFDWLLQLNRIAAKESSKFPAAERDAWMQSRIEFALQQEPFHTHLFSAISASQSEALQYTGYEHENWLDACQRLSIAWLHRVLSDPLCTGTTIKTLRAVLVRRDGVTPSIVRMLLDTPMKCTTGDVPLFVTLMEAVNACPNELAWCAAVPALSTLAEHPRVLAGARAMPPMQRWQLIKQHAHKPHRVTILRWMLQTPSYKQLFLPANTCDLLFQEEVITCEYESSVYLACVLRHVSSACNITAALKIVASIGSTDMFDTLMHKFSRGMLDQRSASLFFHAARANRADILERCFIFLCQTDTDWILSTMRAAIARNGFAALEMLLLKRNSHDALLLNDKGESYETLLMDAVRSSALECMRVLLRYMRVKCDGRTDSDAFAAAHIRAVCGIKPWGGLHADRACEIVYCAAMHARRLSRKLQTRALPRADAMEAACSTAQASAQAAAQDATRAVAQAAKVVDILCEFHAENGFAVPLARAERDAGLESTGNMFERARVFWDTRALRATFSDVHDSIPRTVLQCTDTACCTCF